MSSLVDLRDAVKGRYRITQDDLDSLIDSYINQAYKKYGRRFGWHQLYTENAQLTLTAGDETYDLPSNFWRINPDSVRYDVTSTDPGTKLTVIGKDQLATYKLLDTASQPMAVSVVAGASGSLRALEFVPAFTETSKVVEYDYWKTPTQLTEDANDPVVEEFEEVIVYDALVNLALYHSDKEQAGFFKGELREQLNIAVQAVS